MHPNDDTHRQAGNDAEWQGAEVNAVQLAQQFPRSPDGCNGGRQGTEAEVGESAQAFEELSDGHRQNWLLFQALQAVFQVAEDPALPLRAGRNGCRIRSWRWWRCDAAEIERE